MFEKPRVFDVDFEPSNGVFYAGQNVTGNVHLVTDTFIHQLTGIRLSFHGCAKVHWTESGFEGEGENRRSVERHLSSGETYFESHQYVMGNGITGFLNPGEYFFPFSFPLPSTIPSSFEHEFGHVRYHVKATISAGSPYRCFDYKAYFSVASILDLNQEPFASQECSGNNSKTFGCLCCRSGPLSASVHLHKSGYVPGEPVYVCAEIDNKSNKLMNGSSVKIIQKILFKAENQTKTIEKILGEKWQGQIQPGFEDYWSDVPIFIPPVPPSKLIYCTIIEVHYFLQFRVNPSGIGFDLVVDLPLLIGTIPLTTSFNMFVNQQDSSMQGASAPTAPPAPWQQNNSEYGQLAPPSYVESVTTIPQNPNNIQGQRDKNEDGNANWDFSPKYATWNVKQ